MKKRAYVMNIIKKARYSYLDVVLEDASSSDKILGVGCSSCEGSCNLCGGKPFKSIRVWNKSDGKFEKGDEIYLEVWRKNYFLQLFFAMLLPIILFIATFFLLEASYGSEVFSIMLAFLVFVAYGSLFAICSKYIFYRFFIPFV